MIMIDWQDIFNTAQAIIAVIGGIVGLVAAVPGIILAVKQTIAKLKAQNKQQNWAFIMSIADAAMKEAEASGKAGADKKAMVIASVKASCKAAGVDVDDFVDDLVTYIDETISLVNEIKAATATKKTTKK